MRDFLLSKSLIWLAVTAVTVVAVTMTAATVWMETVTVSESQFIHIQRFKDASVW
jgi:hypothetical protein